MIYCICSFAFKMANPSVERTSSGLLRKPAAAAHVERSALI